MMREGKPRWVDGAKKPAGGSSPAPPAHPALGGPAACPVPRSPSVPMGLADGSQGGGSRAALQGQELQPRGAGQKGGGKHESLPGSVFPSPVPISVALKGVERLVM